MKSNKKMVVAVAAAALSLGVSANAMASFAAGDLTRYVYDASAKIEVGSDLGVTSALVAGAGSAASTNLDAVNFSSKGINTSIAQLGYFSYNSATKQLYISGEDLGIGNNTNYTIQWTTPTSTALTSVLNGYKAKGVNDFTAAFGASTFTYYKNIDKSGAATGLLTGSIITSADSDNPYTGYMNASLASLSAPITQGLYQFDLSAGGQIVGTEVAQIITNTDGSTTVATPTPIPAAFYLMGSGLMGLVGLRRKKA